MPILKQIQTDIAPYGLTIRGGFLLDEAEKEGFLKQKGKTFQSLILIGHLGSDIWQSFQTWLKVKESLSKKTLQNPLDTWSLETISVIAKEHNATAIFPFDNDPYYPFQQWAMRADPNLKPSPLNILIHPEYGLWHAYRGAILLETAVAFEEISKLPSPCEACEDRPCLSACPVDAFQANQVYLYDICQKDLSITSNNCLNQGCAARLACPIGTKYRYNNDQMRFYMRAFHKNPN